ncbi:Nuclear transcription factor Y subunit C-9 [Camellia lanceoleosa]|uniref:Nuclear transcription factor Y subunit C-9 n=1 Tax=Camellia lanceoleosa TaxID=1840588 RepID=A0ACC0HD82_9ERIC|nr:Nuclear transcription factor Y subunit C-9 [Camellia lanceoleosa]
MGSPLLWGVVGSSAQMPYGVGPYQANQMMRPSAPPPVGSTQSPQTGGTSASPAQLVQHQLAYPHIHQQQQQQLQQQLQGFWASQYQEIEQTSDFKNHSLPLARIKKIMKADEDVRMISAEAPVVFARACEMFILELTLRSWNHTEENKRRMLQQQQQLAYPHYGLVQHQLAYPHIHQQQQQQLQQQLQGFWASQYQEIEQTSDFKNHSLLLARIKKIMKADEDVRMISAEAPVVFARACEMFILELTLRSWNHTEENKRRTLQKNDIAAAITRNEIFDFLVDIVPREDLKDEVLASMPRGTLPVGGLTEGLPYYYMPPQHAPQVGAPGMFMGKPVDQALYGQQSNPYAAAQQMWPHQQQPPADS